MGFNDPRTDSDSTAERAPSDHSSKLSGSTCKHGQASGKFQNDWLEIAETPRRKDVVRMDLRVTGICCLFLTGLRSAPDALVGLHRIGTPPLPPVVLRTRPLVLILFPGFYGVGLRGWEVACPALNGKKEDLRATFQSSCLDQSWSHTHNAR